MLTGNDASISIPGYAGHRYQLQSSLTLRPGEWQDLGGAKLGTGTMGTPVPLEFSDPGVLLADPGKFYRFEID